MRRKCLSFNQNSSIVFRNSNRNHSLPVGEAATLYTTESMHPIPVWIDCDPGHDDVCAIILAGMVLPYPQPVAHHVYPGYSSQLEVMGISTVGCNQTLEKVTANALSTLHATGLDHIGVCFLCVYPAHTQRDG